VCVDENVNVNENVNDEDTGQPDGWERPVATLCGRPSPDRTSTRSGRPDRTWAPPGTPRAGA
jgi:hypothetical protein